jgi:hypothetical protein
MKQVSITLDIYGYLVGLATYLVGSHAEPARVRQAAAGLQIKLEVVPRATEDAAVHAEFEGPDGTALNRHRRAPELPSVERRLLVRTAIENRIQSTGGVDDHDLTPPERDHFASARW